MTLNLTISFIPLLKTHAYKSQNLIEYKKYFQDEEEVSTGKNPQAPCSKFYSNLIYERNRSFQVSLAVFANPEFDTYQIQFKTNWISNYFCRFDPHWVGNPSFTWDISVYRILKKCFSVWLLYNTVQSFKSDSCFLRSPSSLRFMPNN